MDHCDDQEPIQPVPGIAVPGIAVPGMVEPVPTAPSIVCPCVSFDGGPGVVAIGVDYPDAGGDYVLTFVS